VEARIKSSSGKETRTSVELRILSADERRKNALKALGICWGISILSIPLPPIHWVTVPGFFFFGFYMAWKRWNEKVHSLPFSFPCPECGKTVEVKEHASKEQMEIVCPHCRYSLQVESPPSAQTA
jgi:DNA-directed RNA polymerase subunit RPC12/RpoP